MMKAEHIQEHLASQPTLSRCISGLGENDIETMNHILKKLYELGNQFGEAYGQDFTKHYVMYDDFYYQAASWSKPEPVVCRVERAPNKLLPGAIFIVTTLTTDPKTIVKAYNKRGNMENFIKESKIDFSMSSVSHTSFVANAVKTTFKLCSSSPHPKIFHRIMQNIDKLMFV